MVNPLLAFWLRLLGQPGGLEQARGAERVRHRRRALPVASAQQAEATIFLILRRMRAPLIVLIVIFALSVLGLTLIPGQDASGAPARMSLFDAFYFMSYTATTIGFGELPMPFTYAQRLWVTGSIYLTVIGWAYAIGSLLALQQDRAFRQALALQYFRRKVRRLREPFLLIVGHGRTGELLSRTFDRLGRRVVVIDADPDRIDALELGSYHADVPGLVADARDPGHLGVAGLGNPRCAAVLAVTNDDEANLAVTMTVALLRPDVQVMARTISPATAQRMRAFGNPIVVNPFDRWGDHLRLGMRAPASYQLISWLESGPSAELPRRGHPPSSGHWVVFGFGRFGRELTADLRAEGLDVTVVEPNPGEPGDGGDTGGVITGHGFEPGILERCGVAAAVGMVAATDNDTANLSLVAAARELNPALYVAARQNLPANAPLFAGMELDSVLVATEVVAHEVYAQLNTPLLWRFLQEVPGMGDRWAAELIGRMSRISGRRLGEIWKIRITARECPAVYRRLADGESRVGDLLRDPDDRDGRLAAQVLMVLRGERPVMTPDDAFGLAHEDELLLHGRTGARRAMVSTLTMDSVSEYVHTGRHVPIGWLWRRLAAARSPGSR